MGSSRLITVNDHGLYCARGDFYIDPWKPVERAVITHAHADHARRGSGRYLTSNEGRHVLANRMDAGAVIDTLEYGEELVVNGVSVSLHPAGHILGSSQVRVEFGGDVWVITGDYKIAPDSTCAALEVVRCHTLVTECTFGLPIYRWPTPESVWEDLNAWWSRNAKEGRTSVVFAYALGKAQRILSRVEPSTGPIYCHGAVERVNAEYRRTGVRLPDTMHPWEHDRSGDWGGALIIAPPSALGTPWLRKFGDAATSFASGWMIVRGARRRRSVERGFVLSDHVDWPGLVDTIAATGAERVLATHGYTSPLVRWLRERGIDADSLQTQFIGERDDVEIDRPDDVEDVRGEVVPA